jgi:hypothetical protein
MKNEQNSNSTSTPKAGTESGTVDPVTQAIEVVYEFPRVQEIGGESPVLFGDRKESLRVSDTECVEIDAYFFASKTNLRLKKIKPALAGLKKQGVRLPDGKEIDAVWFNTNVRDPFHKVLRYAANHSLKHGEPVSLAFTRRVINKETGETVTTAKHGFEFKTLPAPKHVADTADKTADKTEKKEKSKSKTRAKRQQGKKNLQPLVSPEAANRIDAMVAGSMEAAAKLAAEAANGAPATEQK